MFGDDDSDDYSSLFETGVKLYYLSQYQNLEGFHAEKNLYHKAKNVFIVKLRKKYPQTTDAEIFSFFRFLNLLFEPAENVMM